MKKFLIILLGVFLIGGCANKEAKDAVFEYLGKYKNHSEEVLSSLNELMNHENLTDAQKNRYILIMKRQYDDLEYKITNETYNGNKATIDLEITVYDFIECQKEAKEEMQTNKEKYILEDGSFDKIKYQNLQLKYMEKNQKRIKYTIAFQVYYENNAWKLETPDYKVIEKIHGIYDYNEEDKD